MASETLKRLYREVRKAEHGYCSPPGKVRCNWQSAIILRQWNALADMGLVRLRTEWDMEASHEEGCDAYIVCGDFCLPYVDSDGYWQASEDWDIGGSIGACTGYRDAEDWRQNDYVIGVMAETIASFALAWKDRVHQRCRSCHRAASVA